jgi:hypothetical protein
MRRTTVVQEVFVMRFEDALDRQEAWADRGGGWRVAWSVSAPFPSFAWPLRSLSVRLTQLDGVLPNLALMRLSAWHKARGDVVVFSRSPYGSPTEPPYDHPNH